MVSWISLKAVVIRIYKHPYQTVINTFLLVTLIFIANSAVKLENDIILSRISDYTIDQIIAVSSFTRSYDAVKIDKKGERELLDAGAPKWNQHSGVSAVLFHARKAKLSIEHQAVLLSIVEVESGFNPIARAPTTSACGLFQFVKATGRRYRLSRENCMDPWLNAEAGVKHYVDNYKNRIQKEVSSLKGSERVFKLFELGYYLHHDGPESLSPSDNVKSVVLRGTPFLLKVHGILENEQQSKKQMTGVMEYLAVSLQNITKIVVSSVLRFTESLGSGVEEI